MTENCLTGHPTVCATFNDLNFGGAMDDGTRRLRAAGGELATFFGQSSFATYAIVHERNAVPVDAEADLALLGPLGCGIQTGAGTVLKRRSTRCARSASARSSASRGSPDHAVRDPRAPAP